MDSITIGAIVMATKTPSKARESTPPETVASSTPPAYSGHHDHSFTLQAVMEMQKSIGSLESTVATLVSKLDANKASMDELKKKVGTVEKVIYASGVVLILALSLGGWMLNTAKDFAMTYYKASLESQIKSGATQTPPAAPSTKR